ncbi:MAG: gliding motility-associated C-terminal domain-containing protein [Bacteroidota bacterium]
MKICTRFLYLALLGFVLAPQVQAAKPMCVNLNSVIVADENCSQANGSITVDHDGTAPFTYQWTHDANLNDSIATGLTQGTYTVKVIDNTGCEAETTLTLINTPPPTSSLLSQTDVSCFGGTDGSATIDLGPGLTVNWNANPPQNSATLTGVGRGTYTATVSDSFGCQTFVVVNLSEPNPILLSGTSSPDTCGAPNGRGSVSVASGGVSPYSYQWSASAGNQTGASATGLRGGNYTVTVTDADGCSNTINLNVGSVSNNFGGSLAITPPLCFGGDDGEVIFTGVGGNGNYAVDWVNTAQNVVATGLSFGNASAGLYQAVATDPNGDGCEVRLNFFVTQPDSMRTNFRLLEASGCRTPDATVFVTPTGGTPPYNADWSNGQSGDTIFNIRPGLLNVTVTDVNGCEATDRVVVTSAPGPEFDVEILQEDNCGLGEGIARLNISVGTPPYQVIWNTNPTQNSDTSLIAFDLVRTGTNGYSVIVIDSDSCVDIQGFFMPGNRPLAVASTSSTDEYCDLRDGTATADFTGGTLPYSYEWSTSPKQTTQTASGLLGGTYQVIMRDSFDCDITTTVEVGEEAGFSLEVITTDETCYGQEDGVARALVTGGRGPFEYRWSTTPQQQSAEATNLADGSYVVEVRDIFGCERTEFGIVESVDRVIADFLADTDSLGPIGLTDANFRFLNRSEGADQYLWDFGDGNVSTDFEPVHAYADTGTFFVNLIASNNFSECRDTAEIGPIIVTQDGVIHVPSAFTPNQDGFNDRFFIGGENVENMSLRVYSRWGEEVFAASALSDRWDGTLPSGGPAPEGVYVYVLQATLLGSKPFVQRGTITLLR